MSFSNSGSISRERERLVTNLNELSQVQSSAFASVVWEFDSDQISRLMGELDALPHVAGAVVYDISGDVLGRSGDVEAAAQTPRFRAEQTLVYREGSVAESVGRLIIAVHDGAVWTVLGERIIVDILIVLVVAASLTAVTLVTTNLVINRPIRRLQATTGAMAGGDLDARSNLRRADEIGELALAFNDMADTLGMRERDLRRMSKVFMDAADPIMIENLDGVVVELNEETVRAYGWSRAELIGKPIETIVPPERHEQAHQLLERCLRGEDLRNIEGLRWTKNGQIIPVLLTLSLLRNEAGESEAVATLAKDISAQKQAEAELQRYSEQLEHRVNERTVDLAEAEAQLRTALSSMTGGIFLVDKELRLRVWNERLLDLYGVDEAVVYEGAPLGGVLRVRAERGEYGPGDVDGLVEQRLEGYRLREVSRIEDVRDDGRIIGDDPRADRGWRHGRRI